PARNASFPSPTLFRSIRSKAHTSVYSVDSEDSLRDGLRILAEKGIGALVVLSGGRLVGIVSERDYVRKVALSDPSMLDAKISEIDRKSTRLNSSHVKT